jgi:hypothetical protein
MITAADIQTIRTDDPGAVLPGIDTLTGNPYATSSLLDVTKITQNNKAPYYYSPSANTVYVTQAGAVLSGIDFGSATVQINANASNVTINDCTFSDTSSFWAINDLASGATVENSSFIGSKSPTEKNIWISSFQDITIEDNSFINSPEDAIAIQDGVITGNYFSGEGWATVAHGDAIYVPATVGPVSITDNFIDDTLNAGQTGYSNTNLRITDEAGNNNDGVTVTGNYLIGAGFNFETAVTSNTNYSISNVSVTNNYLGFAIYSQYFPGTEATISGNIAVDYTNPAASTQALVAYVAAGVPTPVVVSGTPGGAGETGSIPTTLLGNGYVSAGLGSAGTGETNFVGGFGEQILHGGQGANLVTYLALGDGGDVMTGFDPGKDVIDLSHIDADILTPGLQNFTFIGSAPFNGGAEVRYQLNPTNYTTTVQATLAGDTTADFSIMFYGLVPLTAADFALTAAQSTAALADGAALTYTPVTTPAGAPTEYAYANVQGRAYTTYDAFYGTGYENLEADDLNLSASANELLLYDPSQTVTKGGGAETLTVGTGSDPLTYHATETIDATTSGGEQFIFSAGFGNETINGYNASGATPDSLQLAISAFSYLTPGMTQAQDLAAVLSHASNGLSNLTINDTHGDSLTLTGVTSAMVGVNPAMLQFV